MNRKMDRLEQLGIGPFPTSDRQMLETSSHQTLLDFDKILQRDLEKYEFSQTLKDISKSVASALENYFDGTTNIPFTSFKPHLTGWSQDIAMIVEQSSSMFNSVSEKVVDNKSVPDGVKFASKVVTTAILRDSKNKASSQK